MATNTYVALDKIIVGTATPSITFTSIPSTYTDLVLVVNEFNSTATNTSFQFQVGNGSIDTGANYSLTELYGTGSAAGSDRATSDTAAYFNGPGIGTSTTTPNVYVMNFMNYSNTTTYKTFLGRGGSADKNTVATVNLWRSTSAINTIKVFQSTNNIAAGSTFSLYGIKAWAPETSPKATGGYVTSDSTYWYHTFPFTSTFTPSQSLTVDYLVLAGGGGANGGGGGGGAGGLTGATSVSLTSGTAYTATVGGGGAGVFWAGIGANGSNSSFSSTTAIGGGGGAHGVSGANGGSGGSSPQGQGYGTGTSGQGNDGGNSTSVSPNYPGGGGGGAGAAGSANNGNTPGNGGAGSNAYSSWASATGTGVSGYYAGGGAGGGRDVAYPGATGGIGGGGNGYSQAIPGGNGVVSTGGGGGVGGGTAVTYGGSGGSGLVIVRYAK